MEYFYVFLVTMQRLTFTRIKRQSTFYVKRMLTTLKSDKKLVNMYDIPRPRSLPIIGNKLDFIFNGSGAKLVYWYNILIILLYI